MEGCSYWCRLGAVFILVTFLLSSFAATPSSRHQSSKQDLIPLANFTHDIWQTNPAIQSAQADVARANADYSQSRRPLYNPSLNLDGERIHNDEKEDTYTAGLSQTIDLFNKRKARAKVGRYGLVEAKANLSQQKLVLATETLTALTEYRTAQSVVQLATRRTQLLQRFKEQNVRKFRSGDIAQDAVDQASLAYAEAISQQADEEMALIKAQERLIAITDITPDHWPELPARLPIPIHAVSMKQQQWLTTLPIMQVYRAQVAAAQATIRVAKTETKPDPTVSLRGGAENSKFLVGAGLSIPLFIRNNFTDQVRAANHQAIAVEQMRMNIYRQSKAALQGSLSRYQILYQANILWEKVAKDSLQSGIQLLNRLWLAGELSTTDYLVQLKQRINSQIAGAKLKGQAWQQWFLVMKSSGQLNHWLSQQ